MKPPTRTLWGRAEGAAFPPLAATGHKDFGRDERRNVATPLRFATGR
jgi:hypothetical protein